jgi:DNA-binding NarL/FixJ family response regulator
MTIKLLVVDDHEVVRRGIGTLLDDPDIQMIGILGGGEDVLESVLENVDRLKPDVVLLDVRMEPVDGLAVLDDLRKAHPDLPIVMLSSFDNPTYIARSVALGANDFVLKGDSREHMLTAIRRAADRQTPSTESLLSRTRRSMDARNKPSAESQDLPITARELQVLRHIALGLSNKEIAQSLSISVETVKEHVQNILRKLNAADRTDAAVRAVKLGVV